MIAVGHRNCVKMGAAIQQNCVVFAEFVHTKVIFFLKEAVKTNSYVINSFRNGQKCTQKCMS